MGSGKQNKNQERIFRLLRTEHELTRQDIAGRLGLSMPTTLQNISELAEAGIVEEGCAVDSTGGRKARKVHLRKDAGVAVGIEVALHHVKLVAVDLLGNEICSRNLQTVFSDDLFWYKCLGETLLSFLCENHIEEKRVCGAGVSFPGIIDTNRDFIVRSHIFSLEHIGLDRFRKCISFPMVFANDANCACVCECGFSRRSFVYVSLNETVGGAVMLDGRLAVGDSYQAGEIGHMVLVPGGRACYCGKSGCVDSYLSPKVLTQGKQTLDAFFQTLQAGEKWAYTIWEEYLEYLSILITNLRMVTNMDIVLGGAVSRRMAPYLESLYEKATEYDRFARDIDYIFLSRPNESACAAGAALLALEQYADRVLDRDKEIT